jgi:hypothetical protein
MESCSCVLGSPADLPTLHLYLLHNDPRSISIGAVLFPGISARICGWEIPGIPHIVLRPSPAYGHLFLLKSEKLPTFIGTNCGGPRRTLDPRTPATVVQARRRQWAVLTFLMRSAMAAALVVLWLKVTDSSGEPVYGALVIVEGANESRFTTVTDDKGVFRISSLAPGNYSVKISASAFSDWTASNVPASATPESKPLLAVLEIAPQVTTVTVGVPPEEVAAEQITHELKQRTLAVIPNYYVSYESDPAPLSPKQKTRLSLRLLLDPAMFAAAGIGAGIQQAKNSYWEWGQGAEGYAKRFIAGYGTAAQNLMITSVLAASVLHQDPRYFYSGRGTKAQRAWYALASAFRSKGDNGEWQPPYANLIGAVASAEIADTYYPGSRTQYTLLGRSLMFHFVGLAAVNLGQEFLLKKVTSHKSNQQGANTVLREGTPVRLIAIHGFSADDQEEGRTAEFILSEALTVDSKVLARAGDIASGQVGQVSRAEVPVRRSASCWNGLSCGQAR